MKAMKAMKAMKKAKRVSTIAKGSSAKLVVFNGTKVKTVVGLTKAALTKSSTGKIVSKKASANGKKAFTPIKGWNKAVASARKALSLTGFVAVNGKTAQGKALYARPRPSTTSEA